MWSNLNVLDWQHQHNRLHPVVLVPSETSLAASQNKCYDMLQIPSALLRVSIWSGLFYSSHRAETSPIHSNIPDCLFSRFGSVLCLPSPSPKNEIRIPNNTNKPSKIEVDSFAHLQVAGSSINFWLHRNRICLFSHPLNPNWSLHNNSDAQSSSC